MNRQVRLAARPVGVPKAGDWEHTTEPVGEPGRRRSAGPLPLPVAGPGDARLDERRALLRPAGRHRRGHARRRGRRGVGLPPPGFEVGQHVVGMFGVQECAVSDGRGVLTVDPALPPLPTYLGSGEVPVRRRGARLRPAIDYKSADVPQALRPEAPDGVEVYFDNVGRDILDAVLGRLARGARVVICGAISQYNSEGAVAGPPTTWLTCTLRPAHLLKPATRLIVVATITVPNR